ncbi:MAG: HAMP domain-containing histidine kinase [Planctomycetaceae bacterium]|nr:HAMP domain-containing histidine kinase [Planctomycetaceae bacterium]
MRWQRGVTVAALLLAWALLVVWQWQEYQAECAAAREGVRRQADSVMNALVGGVQSHRRLGRFLEDALQGMLDALAKSQDILAVAVVSSDQRLSLSAGNAKLLDLKAPIEPGQSWQDAGFRYAVAFQVMPEMPGPGPGGLGPPGLAGAPPWQTPSEGSTTDRLPPPEPFATTNRAGASDRSPVGNNHERHEERGVGRGRGPNWRFEQRERTPLAETPDGMRPPATGRVLAVLLLDRSRTDEQIARFAWLRGSVVLAGGLVILSIALVWRATVRLADARGHARLLENEARHLRELSQASTGLAHETRNPLGLIRGWTQRWAQSIRDNPQQQHQAQSVLEECDRVTARINQFLAFARPCEPRPTDVRPADVVTELAVLLEPDLDAKRLRLVASPSMGDRTVRADREMFRQALFNLAQNAIEFSSEGATVEVDAKSGTAGSLRIEVADRGPGVPPEAVDLLFTPYHTTRSNGTGLGLAIVRRIATAHGWTVGYSPRPGGGAIFWIDTASAIHGRT